MSLASNNGVGTERNDDRSVRVVVIQPNLGVDDVIITGSDSERFAMVSRLAGRCSITAVPISDQDGPAALGWIDEHGIEKSLQLNHIASELVGRSVVGPMVVTGLGHGDLDSMSSVHQGLRDVLGRMANDYGDPGRTDQRQRT